MAKRKRKKKRIRIKKKVSFKSGVLLIIAALFTAFVVYVYSGVPNIDTYTYREQTSSVVYTSDGRNIGEISSKNITYVDREDIPDLLINAVVSIEDKRFYKHNGVDIIGIIRAVINNIKEGEIVEGASTLTQQVAKILFFSNEQSYIRKLREAVSAIKLEKKYSKDEILTIYLNEIYFGGGAFGVYEASMTYFNVPPSELSLAQSAMLAGIIQAPSAYCPLDAQGYGYASQRKDKVISLMLENGYITKEEADAATSEQVVINGAYDEETFDYGEGRSGYRAFLNKVYEESIECLAEHYKNELGYKQPDAYEKAESLLYSENLTINTTMNYEMQENMLEAVSYRIEENADNVSCAFVSVDAKSGGILCYYGADHDTYIDMADTPRQCGSTIKPLYMLYLIENGLADENTVVLDAPVEINGYSPGNYAGIYKGYVTMRETLTDSLNSASLRLFQLGKINEEIDFIKKLGISTLSEEDTGYALALGGLYNGTKPIEMASAYSVICSGGYISEPVCIVSIADENGTLIYPPSVSAEKAVSVESAEKMKSCLESVVIRGTGVDAQNGYETFGKTGTTDDNRDVWFVGGSGNVVSAVWAGNIDAEEVDGLTTSWTMRAYRDFITASASEGVYASSLSESGYYEPTTTISVLKPEVSAGGDIADTDVTDILIREEDIKYFSSRQVVKLAIDSSTGLLYSDKCPKKNREEKYYTIDTQPVEYCNKSHYKENIEQIWDELKNKKF